MTKRQTLRRPPFLGKPRGSGGQPDHDGVGLWLQDWVNVGFNIDEDVVVKTSKLQLQNQAIVRSWLDRLIEGLKDHEWPEQSVRKEVIDAAADYRLVCQPSLTPDGKPDYRMLGFYRGGRVEHWPDDRARLAIMMREVIYSGRYRRFRKCRMDDCERFKFTPMGAGRVGLYCCTQHKDRHTKRMSRR